jgi:tetratricopeptide (TPR) repeat protein
MSRRFSLFKTVTLFALLAVLLATRSGIAQPLNKAARSSLDIAYEMAWRNMIEWSAVSFQDASRAAPESVEPRLLGGLAYLAVGKEAEAAELWQEAQALGEQAVSGLLGDLLFAQGDLEGAQAAYENALAALPRAAKARVGLALISEKKGNLQEAIAYVEPLTELPSGDDEVELYAPMTDAFYHLGRLYLADERLDKAQEVLKLGTRLDPHHPEMHFTLGKAYERNGAVTEAIHLYERALQLDPNSRSAAEALGRLRPTR